MSSLPLPPTFRKVTSISIHKTTSHGDEEESVVQASNLQVKRKRSWISLISPYHGERERRGSSEDIPNPWEKEDDPDMQAFSLTAHSVTTKRKRSWMSLIPPFHGERERSGSSEDILNPWEKEGDPDMQTLSFVAHSVSGGLKKTNLSRKFHLQLLVK